MKEINIITGEDYKVTHKKTKKVYFMTAQELANFLFKYGYKNYKIDNLNKKLIDYIPFWLIISVMVAAYTVAIILHIQLNY
tara:strand:- start:183 stop:425 length:243 start_codon:yes stop_codon:yes gene_type:complete